MVLNSVWISFFLSAFLVGLFKFLFYNDANIFTRMVESTFTMAEKSVTISIYLIGVITLWMGFMKIGEKGGAVRILARVVRPFFHKLFPDLPEDHPAHGSILMNFSANMLGPG